MSDVSPRLLRHLRTGVQMGAEATGSAMDCDGWEAEREASTLGSHFVRNEPMSAVYRSGDLRAQGLRETWARCS